LPCERLDLALRRLALALVDVVADDDGPRSEVDVLPLERADLRHAEVAVEREQADQQRLRAALGGCVVELSDLIVGEHPLGFGPRARQFLDVGKDGEQLPLLGEAKHLGELREHEIRRVDADPLAELGAEGRDSILVDGRQREVPQEGRDMVGVDAVVSVLGRALLQGHVLGQEP
jgi:hypothetical protein